MYNSDFFQNTSTSNNVEGSNNYINNETEVDVNVNNMSMPQNMNTPINEGVQEKVVHRTFVHEVPHVCPIHTRVINHHVYRHTYRPCYTCSEENVCSNVQCGSCNCFK